MLSCKRWRRNARRRGIGGIFSLESSTFSEKGKKQGSHVGVSHESWLGRLLLAALQWLNVSSQKPPAINLTCLRTFCLSVGFQEAGLWVVSSRITEQWVHILGSRQRNCSSVFFSIKWWQNALDFGRWSWFHILCSVFPINVLMFVWSCSGKFGLCTSGSPTTRHFSKKEES